MTTDKADSLVSARAGTLTEYQRNHLESLQNWLDTRASTAWAQEFSYATLMREYATTIEKLLADDAGRAAPSSTAQPCEHDWSEPHGFVTRRCKRCLLIEPSASTSEPATAEPLEYLTHVANAFDPVEGPVEFTPAVWTQIRNSIFALSARAQHVDGRWCEDLKCSKCYSADTWQKAVVSQRPAGCRYPNREGGATCCAVDSGKAAR